MPSDDRYEIRPGWRCRVCAHAEIEEIEVLLTAYQSWPRHKRPRFLRLAAIAALYSVPSLSLQEHMTPQHQRRRATDELQRLHAIQYGGRHRDRGSLQ